MLDTNQNALIAISNGDGEEISLTARMANRHGLITGATGTGKTVTLQTMAETFSQMGVPVFAADVKGDLSSVVHAGGNKDSVKKRVDSYKLESKGFSYQQFPVQFWDVFGEQGVPLRATVNNMGATMISRIMNLNDTQTAILSMVFKIAQDEDLELIDLKDLQKMVAYVGENASKFTVSYGNISTASIGAIQRGLLQLEQEGVANFWGEPSLNIDDFFQTEGGKGVINILAADKLMNSPKVYTTFLFWLMSNLFDVLPEVGDMEKPKLVFFFDEAHLLFKDASKPLLEKMEQIVRLIRSKGVGIYFVSQSPSDIPDSVLGQLGNRIQHALRAYTPKDQKALKVAAQTFRANELFDTEKAISELAIGEALISFLDEKGTPQPVSRANILPPQGRIGGLSVEERDSLVKKTILYRHYSQLIDRESAHEKLSERMQLVLSDKENKAQQKEEEKTQKEQEKSAKQADKQKQKIWSVILSAFLVPLTRQLVNTFVRSLTSPSKSTSSTRKRKR